MSDIHHDRGLDLSSAPVLFHLQHDSNLLAYIQDNCDGNTDNLNLKEVFDKIVSSGSGIQMTHELCRTHAKEALKDIDDIIPEGDAKAALTKLIKYLNH